MASSITVWAGVTVNVADARHKPLSNVANNRTQDADGLVMRVNTNEIDAKNAIFTWTSQDFKGCQRPCRRIAHGLQGPAGRVRIADCDLYTDHHE